MPFNHNYTEEQKKALHERMEAIQVFILDSWQEENKIIEQNRGSLDVDLIIDLVRASGGAEAYERLLKFISTERAMIDGLLEDLASESEEQNEQDI